MQGDDNGHGEEWARLIACKILQMVYGNSYRSLCYSQGIPIKFAALLASLVWPACCRYWVSPARYVSGESPMPELTPYMMRLTFPSERGETTVLVGPADQEEERLSLRDCWWVMTNRLRLIAVFFCGTVLTTALLLVLIPPTYTAEVMLLIERKLPRVLDRHEASADLFVPDDHDFYKTQYALLKSRALAAQVIRELQLHPQHLRGEGKGMLEGVKLDSR